MIMTTAGLRAIRAAVAMMGVAATGAAGAETAQAPALKALRTLETGEWSLRIRGEGDGAEVRKLCVSDLRMLLQIQHSRHVCRSFVVSDTATAATVTYDCAGAGNGRTELRVETPRLVQISSQGIADGAPFAFAMEGRRVGACQ